MNNPLCSICCISYNHEKFIPFAMESFFNQTYKNIEIIALDDGSKDASLKVLENYKNNSPYPMTIIAQENSGKIGANFNKAIKQAKGEYIVIISLDDGLPKNAIEEKINIMKKDTNIAFIASTTPDFINAQNEKKEPTVLIIDKQKGCKLDIDYLLNLEYTYSGAFYIQGAVFRKRIIDNVAGFDEDTVGDDIFLRTKIFKYIKNNPQYTFEILYKPGVYYRIHGNNISKNPKHQFMILSKYYQTHWTIEEMPPTLIAALKNFIKHTSSISEVIEFFIDNPYLKPMLHNSEVNNAISISFDENSNKYGAVYKHIPIITTAVTKYRNFTDKSKCYLFNIFGIKIPIKQKMK